MKGIAHPSAGTMALVCSLLLLGALFGCSSKEEKKARHLEKARQYLEKNELQKAVIELKNVIQLDPANDTAQYELGETYLKLKQGNEAFQAFSKAVSTNPDNMKAQLKVGQILLLGRRAADARKKAELVLEKQPNDMEALTLLSGVQVQEKDVDGALETLNRAAKIDPKDFNTRLSIARLFLMKGDFSRAEAAYLEAIPLNPKSNTSYVELSRLYATKRDNLKAEEILGKMIDVGGATYANLEILALFYESTEQWEKAEKTHLRCIDSAPKDDTAPLMNMAGFQARRNQYEKALELMQKALEIKKGDLEIMSAIAQLHFDFRRLEEADGTADKILEKDKGHLAANFLKGRIFLVKRDYVRALEKFDLVVKERPRSDAAYYYRAVTLIQKGEPRLAEQDLVKAIELNPRLLDARLILAESYLRDRNKDLARQQIDLAQRIAPQDVRVLTLLGNLKVLEQDIKGAEEAFKQLVELHPSDPSGYVRMGVFYGAGGRLPDAEKNLRKALELNADQRDAHGVLTGLYIQQKKYDEALRLCATQKQRLEKQPSALAFVEYLEGRIYTIKGDLAKGLQHFEKAIELDPNILGAYEAMAQIHYREKRIDEARKEYEGIVAKNPRHIAGYMALGTIYDQMGEWKKAEESYRKALSVDKDFAPAANNLAWTLIEGGGNIDEALGFAQSAKQKMPKNGAVMDTLGWIYYLKGRTPSAVAELQDAVQIEGQNATIHYHLGAAYYKDNQLDRAKESLEKALALEQGFKDAEKARSLLKEIKAKS
jgi:tetratricopeptide (TPR) repeat protein